MVADPRRLTIAQLRAEQEVELRAMIARIERARRPGDLVLPPTPRSAESWAHIRDTPLTRWACLRAGTVEGWILGPDPRTGDPGLYMPPMCCADGCPATIAECDGRGCRDTGRCGRVG